MIRTATELYELDSFEERFDYLSLTGHVGASTFGFDRHLNQKFYRSPEWRYARTAVIARDLGRDLGVEGYDIHERILIHHMNPISAEDIVHGDFSIVDPEFLISTTHKTHNAIHYGDAKQLTRRHTPRQPGDTALWSRR